MLACLLRMEMSLEPAQAASMHPVKCISTVNDFEQIWNTLRALLHFLDVHCVYFAEFHNMLYFPDYNALLCPQAGARVNTASLGACLIFA